MKITDLFIKKSEKKSDEDYMKEAYNEAIKAYQGGDVPIGCVIVKDGKIIARGHNRRNKDGNVLSHAEITAMRTACRKAGDWRLEDVIMYVTLEPCPMCAGAIVQARIPKVVMACRNPKAGCAGSVINLLDMKGFNHQVEVEEGIMQEECSELLKRFFKELRIKLKEEKKKTNKKVE